jgi:hypothetical protein
MSSSYDLVALNTNHPSGDAFGRVRVSEPFSIWESKLLDGGGERVWSQELGIYANGVKNSALSQYELTVNNSGDYAIRQTLQRFNYQSGKSQLCFISGKMESIADTTHVVGMCDGDHSSHVEPFEIYNGIYFALDRGANRWNEGLNVVITNNGVDNAVKQSDWNMDKLDGNGTSQVTLDITKAQIFVIDFEWLGVGRVRFGFNIDGVTYYVHQFTHANESNAVYTKTPNLPVRYEVRSYGGTSQLNQICSAVMSEGGREPSGFNHIGSSPRYVIPTNGTFTTAVDHTSLAAMRHQDGKPYSFVRLQMQNLITLGANPMKWSIALVPASIEINIDGTTLTPLNDLTFQSLPDSTLEFFQFGLTGLDGVTDAQIAQYIIEEGYIPDTGVGANPSANILGATSNLISLGEDIDGSKWVFLFTVQSYGVNEVRSSLKFTEVI